MAELEDLEQEELDKNLLEIKGAEDVPLPSVPSTSLPSRPGGERHQEPARWGSVSIALAFAADVVKSAGL